jgi:hypothetical protein
MMVRMIQGYEVVHYMRAVANKNGDPVQLAIQTPARPPENRRRAAERDAEEWAEFVKALTWILMGAISGAIWTVLIEALFGII